MDGLLLVSVAFLSIIFSIIGGFIIKLYLDEKNQNASREILQELSSSDAQHRKKRKDNSPIRREDEKTNPGATESELSEENRNRGDGDSAESDDADLDPEVLNIGGKKKIGKKKLAKLQAKAEAKSQRLQEQTEREERKRLEEIQEKKAEEQRLLEESEEQKRFEKLKLEREEKERKELEEYNQLKESFQIEEQGFDHECDLENSDDLMKHFLDFVKSSKVVYIDELASKYDIKPEETINRLNFFIEQGLLNGVFDDRGKFICITNDELSAVAKFINQRGRVSLMDLAAYSNQLISLESAGAMSDS